MTPVMQRYACVTKVSVIGLTGLGRQLCKAPGKSECERPYGRNGPGHNREGAELSQALLPVKRLGLAIARHGLVKRLGVVEAAVQHNHVDLVTLVDILDNVGIEHDEVGELAGLQ